jgi:intein-encoded DNA endonuclease-like protein
MKGKKTLFSEQDFLDIVDMYHGGQTRDEIAAVYNVSGATISRFLKRKNVVWEKKPHRKIDIAEYAHIGEMYENSTSTTDISNEYGVHPATIRYILSQLNIEIRTGGSTNTYDDVIQWKQKYENGKLLKDIAEEYGVTPTTVRKHLESIGVDVDRHIYHFNENFFDIIDSQEKAYILGMLWADGCNNSSKNCVHLSLQEQDVELLKQINNLTNNDRPLRKSCLSKSHNNYQDQYCLTWGSKYFCDVLNDLGMVPRKTLVLEYPKSINEDLHRHFCRGYLDGDGCITLKNNGQFAAISMTGTHMFLNKVKEIISKQLGVEVSVYRDERSRDPICVLHCGRKDDVKKILDWVYGDANIFLQRKYDKYQQFISFNNNINNSCLN